MAKPVETLKQNIWLIANALLALVLLSLLITLFGNGDSLSERAMKEGRRLVINMKTGEIIGSPAKAPEQKEETPVEPAPTATKSDELPAPESIGPQQQMNNAVPANFVGEKLESQQGATPAATTEETAPAPTTEAPPAYDYPVKVKQEPQTRQTATAAPAKPVTVHELEMAPAGKPLASAPIADLVEDVSEKVKLPKIGHDGKRPWEAYRKKFSASSSEPLVTVIVAGLGLNNATQTAFRLQEDFTLSFSPYGKEVAMWGAQARNAGHEVLLDLPMQTQDYPATDPGPYGLLATLAPEDNLKRLHWVLNRFPGFVGLVEPMGASIPTAIIQNCLSDLAARGLLLVELPTGMGAPPADQKSQTGLISLTASHILDSELDEASIQTRLAELVAKAKKDGQAIGIAHPYPLTLQILQKWQKTLAEQEVRLAPVSALAERVKE